jgi:hypothetical protein
MTQKKIKRRIRLLKQCIIVLMVGTLCFLVWQNSGQLPGRYLITMGLTALFLCLWTASIVNVGRLSQERMNALEIPAMTALLDTVDNSHQKGIEEKLLQRVGDEGKRMSSIARHYTFWSWVFSLSGIGMILSIFSLFL